MSKTKYQIFISSTYTDLIHEREQVIKACLEIGHIPVGMEMFSAANEEQWQIITRQIDDSDYYILIMANRYGSVTGGISYTEKEYDYAVSKGIPVLGFVLDPAAAWASDRSENESKARAKLEAFRKKVKRKPVAFWSTKEDLHSKCVVALTKTFNTQPRPGWVRTPEVAGPEVAEEMSRLSNENARLREQLAILASESDLSVFAQGEDVIGISLEFYETDHWVAEEISTTWNELLCITADTILGNPKESAVLEALTHQLYEKARLNENVDTSVITRASEIRIDQKAFREIKVQFITLGFIDLQHITPTNTTDQRRYFFQHQAVETLWRLTTAGQRQYALLSARRRL